MEQIFVFCLVAAILLKEMIHCEASLISSSASSSSSSGYGSSCNGLICPPDTSCTAYSANVNGNSTSDKKCITNNGVVVRQETVTIGNEHICVKNLTMKNNAINVNNNCRKLSDQEKKTFYNKGIYQGQYVKQMTKEQENALNHRQKMLEMRKQQLEEDFRRRESALERFLENMEDQVEARNEQIELQQEAQMLQMEKGMELLERRAEMLEEQKERQMGKFLQAVGKRDARWWK